jgi:hypothetical protein
MLEILLNIFTKLELTLIWAWIICIIWSIFIIKTERKNLHKSVWLSFDKLVEESKKNLWVNELNEVEIAHLKSLGSHTKQNKRYHANIKFYIHNAQLTLYITSLGVLLLLLIVYYHHWNPKLFESREDTAVIITVIVMFIISTWILINYYKNRKNAYIPLINQESSILFIMSISTALCMFLYMIWYF